MPRAAGPPTMPPVVLDTVRPQRPEGIDMAVRFWLPLLAVLAIVAGPLSWANHPTEEKPVTLPGEQGRHHHPIVTTNPEAQKYFDQGMTLHFGFNHAEAVRSFRKAAELDPKAAMPHWGIALALGPNYNRDIDP